MRNLVVSLAFLAAVTPALAQSARDDALVIDIKPKSWLDAGREVRVGYGRDYATSHVFGGGPVNGISSRGFDNLPARNGVPLVQFNFLGAYLNR